MITIPSEMLSELAEAYLLASTPGFLYRKLLQSKALQDLLKSHTVDELRATVTEVEGLQSPTVKEISTGYAAAVALSQSSPESLKYLIDSRSFKRLSWIPRIYELCNFLLAHPLTPPSLGHRPRLPITDLNPRLTIEFPPVFSKRSENLTEFKYD
jgi:hypothetical protein